MKLEICVFYIFLACVSVNSYSFTKVYCYRCISNHPGCAQPFNWWYYWSQQCPEEGDKCVKIIERKGAQELITRDCLSSVRSFRTDIPEDQYEGCRPAAKDVRLAHYVNNSITELDIRRDHFDSVDWCFCYFDNRCNSSSSLQASVVLASVIGVIYKLLI